MDLQTVGFGRGCVLVVGRIGYYCKSCLSGSNFGAEIFL